jgi:molybdenum cofactor cytidylyltransferase
MALQRTGRVAGIVLAAGMSTRMGFNKLFIDVAGESLLRRVVRSTLDAALDPVIVVLGHEAERALDALADLPCQPVVNVRYAEGPNESLRAGIRAVPADAAAALVVLADMPFVTVSMLVRLVAEYRASTAPLVVSEYGGRSAPPALYDRALFLELLRTPGERCALEVRRKHGAEAVRVSWPMEVLRDLDTPDDYERLKQT